MRRPGRGREPFPFRPFRASVSCPGERGDRRLNWPDRIKSLKSLLRVRTELCDFLSEGNDQEPTSFCGKSEVLCPVLRQHIHIYILLTHLRYIYICIYTLTIFICITHLNRSRQEAKLNSMMCKLVSIQRFHFITFNIRVILKNHFEVLIIKLWFCRIQSIVSSFCEEQILAGSLAPFRFAVFYPYVSRYKFAQ